MLESVMHLFAVLVLVDNVRSSHSSRLPEDWKAKLDPKVLTADLGMSEASVDRNGDPQIFLHTDNNPMTDNTQADDSGQKSPFQLGKLQPENFWPNRQNIPYQISPIMRRKLKRNIRSALQQITDRTFGCIAFKERIQEPDYLYFEQTFGGCKSYIGRRGGKHTVDLTLSCLMVAGEIQHQVMHALGMFHEHSRPDRDSYVELYRDNIVPKMLNSFDILPLMETYNLGYDLESVMHYGFNYFARNPAVPTLLPKKGSSLRMGQRSGLSRLDILKLQTAYECPSDSDDIDASTSPLRPGYSQIAQSDTENGNGVYVVPECRRWWRNATIPCDFSGFDTPEQSREFHSAIDVIESQTCVRFRKIVHGDNSYVQYGFTTALRKRGAKKDLSIDTPLIAGNSRLNLGKILETLGFYPEYLRHDRDDYVDIVRKYKAEVIGDALDSYGKAEMPTFGLPYDFDSASHPQFGTHKEGDTTYTIMPKPGLLVNVSVGNLSTLSVLDAKKIDLVYCGDQPCPQRQGWIRQDTRCYFFSSIADVVLDAFDQFGLRSFTDTTAECERIESVIADATLLHARTFIVTKLRASNVKNRTKVWVGGCHTLDVTKDRISKEKACDERHPFVCEKPAKTS